MNSSSFTPEITDPHVKISIQEQVLCLSLARSKKRNAITVNMYRALESALRLADGTDLVRVVHLSGADGHFTGGNDLLDFLQNPPQDETSPVLAFLNTLAGFTKPLIACVSGHAVGIGTTLLLHCDYVAVTPSAQLKLPFVELGLCPEAAASLLLPRCIGYLRAAQMILVGESVDGASAAHWGLASSCREDAYEHSIAIAQIMASRPQASLLLSKQLLKQTPIDSVQQRLATEAEHFTQRLKSPEAISAFQAFLAKSHSR